MTSKMRGAHDVSLPAIPERLMEGFSAKNKLTTAPTATKLIRRWTSDDDDLLRKMFSEGVSMPDMANRLGRSQSATETRMRALRLKGGERREWSKAETAELLNMVEDGLLNEDMALVLDRSPCAVRNKLARMDIRLSERKPR